MHKARRADATTALEEEDKGASGGELRALQHLDAVVEAVTHKDTARAVDCDAVQTVELAGGAARAADSFNVGAIGVAQKLDTVVGAVGYDDVTSAIEGKADRIIKLAVACPLGSDGPQKRAIAVPQHE